MEQRQQKQHHNFHPKLLTLKKTIFYDFIASKEEEVECKKESRAYQRHKYLVEMRDMYPPPQTDLAKPWSIRKVLTLTEVTKRFITVSENEAFDHVFRYWSFETVRLLLTDTTFVSELIIVDMNEEGNPTVVWGFFQKSPTEDCYMLRIDQLVERRRLSPNDEIGLYLDAGNGGFVFRLLGPNVGQASACCFYQDLRWC